MTFALRTPAVLVALSMALSCVPPVQALERQTAGTRDSTTSRPRSDSKGDQFVSRVVRLVVLKPQKVIVLDYRRLHITVSTRPASRFDPNNLSLPVAEVIDPKIEMHWKLPDRDQYLLVSGKAVVRARLHRAKDAKVLAAIDSGKTLYFLGGAMCLPPGSVACGLRSCHVAESCPVHDEIENLTNRPLIKVQPLK